MKPKARVKIYTASYCGFCHRAIDYLEENNVEFENIDVTNDPKTRESASEKAGGFSTVPLIFIDDKFIGGCSELLRFPDIQKLAAE